MWNHFKFYENWVSKDEWVIMRFKHSDYAKGADAEVLLKATIVVCCHYLSCNYI